MSPAETFLNAADDALEDADLLISYVRNSAAANRLYYCVFYCLQALLISKDIKSKTHKGTLIKFNALFIKTKIFDKVIANAVEQLFNLRQGGDYELDDVSDSIINVARQKTLEVLTITKKYFSSHSFEA